MPNIFQYSHINYIRDHIPKYYAAMPKYEQSLTLTLDKEKAFAIAYQAMEQLNWIISFGTEDNLGGSTRKSWKSKGQLMVCTIEGTLLTISSQMINGELADPFSINKKNTHKFVAAFEEARNTINDAQIENNINNLQRLREKTINDAKQQQADAEEMDRAMNLSGSNLYVTYTIIGINILVFILMVMDGAGIMASNPLVHIKWGSNFAPLTLSGDWWRLITCVFIHFGIIHLLMNMYCLYMIGIYLEPMLGKPKFITAYVGTGILASLTSLWWHSEPTNSAGASGAVFGMYGLFLALLTSNLIPKAARQQLLQSIGIFVAYNLVYGMKSGVDNAAHVGGLVSGFVIGFIYVFAIKKEREQDQKLQWIIPAVAVLCVGTAFMYLQQNKASAAERASLLNELQSASYKDNKKFNEKLSEFDAIHQRVNEMVSDTSVTVEELLKNVNDSALPLLRQATNMISSTNSYDISPAEHTKATKLLQYIDLRRQGIELLKQIAASDNPKDLVKQRDEIRQKADSIFAELVSK